MNGILLVDKPLGVSSHGVVAGIRRALGRKRVGHAGTLDPAATGLLVVGVGAGTRLLTFLVGADKSYAATIRLGIGTDTDDAAGTVTSTPGFPAAADVGAALVQFRGPIQQRPSAVSAIKVDGRRAYQRVRAGEDVELSKRAVTVHSLELLEMRTLTDPISGVPVADVDVDVTVSSGTYIRAIARDLGDALGCAGHLISLRRTSVGPFDVSHALAMGDIDGTTPMLRLGEVARQVLPSVLIGPDQVGAVTHGVRLPCEARDRSPVALLTEAGELLSVATCGEDARWRHLFVVPDAGSATLETP